MADSQMPIVLQYLQAVGPTVVAVAVAVLAFFIQYNQWKTSRDKLKIDLFDRRMNAFHIVEKFIWQARMPEDDPKLIGDMQKLLREARFIFDEKTSARLDQVYHDYINLRYDMREGDGQSASHVLKEKQARNNVSEIFRPWLQLGHIK